MSTARALRPWTTLLLCLGVAACGSDKDSAVDDTGATEAHATAESTASAGSAKGGGGPGAWRDYPSAPSKPAYPFNRAFALPPPSPAPDPDVAIERYSKECAGGGTTPVCRALKAQVEGAFLEALLAVRAGAEPVDPEWYRVAAAADTPQLACIGVNELVYLPGRTAQDEALVLKALDHPAPSVRAAAASAGQKIPAVGELTRRWGSDRRGTSGTCLDSATDPVPAAKWAGDYPGARYRAFASGDSRRWFTTSDSLEKVTGWFANSGKPARTSQQIAADAAASFTQQMNEITASPDPDDDQRLMEVMQQMAGGGQAGFDSQAFNGMEGVGEVKYVLLSPTQAIAVFKDDVFQATSIVALRPGPVIDLTPDMEKAQREAVARSILGY